jgi:hypothetical protein
MFFVNRLIQNLSIEQRQPVFIDGGDLTLLLPSRVDGLQLLLELSYIYLVDSWDATQSRSVFFFFFGGEDGSLVDVSGGIFKQLFWFFRLDQARTVSFER